MTVTGKTIVIDLDSTIFPFYDALREMPQNGLMSQREAQKYPELHKANYTGDIREWDDLVDFCGGIETALNLWTRAGQYKSMQHYSPFDHSVKVMKRWKEQGATLILLSDRDPKNQRGVVRWLKQHDIPMDKVMVGRYPNKLEVLKELNADVIIDDKPATIESCHAEGIVTTGLRWHYNRKTAQENGIHMGNSWLGIDQIVRKKLAAKKRQIAC